MGRPAKRLVLLAFGALWVATGTVSYVPAAKAQFFWFFDQPKRQAKPRARPSRPPGDDLPPIVPRESTAPPPPDDRPYDNKLMRLAEILGAVHYLRELCGAQEGQLWREQMKEILRNEGTTAVRRAKLVNSFNDGYVEAIDELGPAHCSRALVPEDLLHLFAPQLSLLGSAELTQVVDRAQYFGEPH